MITILIIPILKQTFSSLHKEFIGENNHFDYAVVLSPANENSVHAFMFLQGSCCVSKYLNTSLHLLFTLILSLYLFSAVTCHSFFKKNIRELIKKVSFFCLLKDIIANFINIICKIFSFLARSEFFYLIQKYSQKRNCFSLNVVA